MLRAHSTHNREEKNTGTLGLANFLLGLHTTVAANHLWPYKRYKETSNYPFSSASLCLSLLWINQQSLICLFSQRIEICQIYKLKWDVCVKLTKMEVPDHMLKCIKAYLHYLSDLIFFLLARISTCFYNSSVYSFIFPSHLSPVFLNTFEYMKT